MIAVACASRGQFRDAGGRDVPALATTLGEAEIRQRAGIRNVDPADVFAGLLIGQVLKGGYQAGRQGHALGQRVSQEPAAELESGKVDAVAEAR